MVHIYTHTLEHRHACPPNIQSIIITSKHDLFLTHLFVHEGESRTVSGTFLKTDDDELAVRFVISCKVSIEINVFLCAGGRERRDNVLHEGS